MKNKAILLLVALCLFPGFVAAGPPGAPAPPPGTAAQLTAGTDTTPRLWTPAILATQFSGASAEVVNEAITAANMSEDIAHAPSQDALHDYLAATIDADVDGNITDETWYTTFAAKQDALGTSSSLYIQDLTLVGAGGLALGVAGSVQGTIRWFSNTPENNYHVDLYGANFTENWGLRWQTAYPTENGGLWTASTTGNSTWTYQGVDPGDLLLLPADPGAHTLFGFDNTTNTYKPITIGTGLEFTQATGTLASTGGFTGGTLTSELVIDETGIEGQPTDALTDCSTFAATGGGIFYDDSEGKWKKCQDNVLTDLDTATGSGFTVTDITGQTDDTTPAATATIVLAQSGALIESTVQQIVDAATITPTNVTPVDTADENATFYPLLVDGATGTQATETDGEFSYNPSTGRLTVPIIYAGAIESSAANGSHYMEAINTVDVAATATLGRIAYGPVSGDATSRHRIADGTDWNNYLIDKEAIDTPAELEALLTGAGAFMSDLLGYATAASVASGIGVGTEDSPQFTAVEVGAASDTTLARVGAGQVSVEGVNVVTTSSADTLTNKTMDAEGTGNSITTVEKIWIAAAGCNNTTSASFLDLPTTNAAAAACITGTNTQKGVLDFDAATDESGQVTIMLPSDATQLTSGGGIDVAVKWLAAATSGSVVWGVQTSCVATAETDDPSWNTATTVTDAALGTTLQTNDATIADVTATGCAAGELLHLRVYRDADNGSDDMTEDARLIGFEVTYRRAQ